MTQFTEHFSAEELTHSDTAEREGFDNTPSADQYISLRQLAILLLEPIRAEVGEAVLVHDAFRSRLVNEAVGGVVGSAHAEGRAADISTVTLTLQELFDRIQALALEAMDQCILESGCVHVALANAGTAPRHEYLVRSGTAPDWKYTVA